MDLAGNHICKPAEPLSWFAIQVRTRFEGSAEAHLRGLGYEVFLPTFRCRRRWSDRIRHIEVPLFPGYLFCRLDTRQRLPVLKAPGVIQIVGIGRNPVPVEESEIAAVQAIVSSGLPRQPWPFLQVGDRVKVDGGPLRGLEGILLSFKGHYRIVVSITLLQRSVALEIDSAWVSPARPQPAHAGAVAWPALGRATA